MVFLMNSSSPVFWILAFFFIRMQPLPVSIKFYYCNLVITQIYRVLLKKKLAIKLALCPYCQHIDVHVKYSAPIPMKMTFRERLQKLDLLGILAGQSRLALGLCLSCCIT